MSRKKRDVARFDDAKTIEALTPLRIEIVQAFAPGSGRLTVRDLAERTGKPRGSLYYHVRKLVEIGILVEADRQLKGKKYESSYEVAADRLEVTTDPSSKSGREAITKLVRSITRLAGREFEKSLESGALSGDEMAEVGHRQRAWLSPDDVEKIGTLLARIEAICARRKTGRRGRLYSMTTLLVPLEPPPRGE